MRKANAHNKFVHLLPNLWTEYCENEWTGFDVSWHKLSAQQGNETIKFGGQEVKVQGHMMTDIDLEAWWRHH